MTSSDTQIKIFAEKAMTRKPENKSRGRLTACEVRTITGLQDENIIQAILASGASRKEIIWACDKCDGIRHTKSGIKKPANKKVRHVHDLIECGSGPLD